MELDIFDLEAVIKSLCGLHTEIQSVYIFGSRRFHTKSNRSDIDLILKISGHLKQSVLRDFTLKNCPALDLFLLDNGKAVSIANESFIKMDDDEALLNEINAVLLYDRHSGSSKELQSLKRIEIDKRVVHVMTSLPDSSAERYEITALKKYFKRANENGLPVKPYIGVSSEEASDFIITVMQRMLDAATSVTNYGEARKGWTNKIESEYNFQNLFWITVKPWLPELCREQVAIKYDGQEKKSDFSLFQSQVIIELKNY